MIVKKSVYWFVCFFVIFALAGCAVRTYTVEKARVDQNLTEGNRGYFQGTPPPPDPNRKTTRKQHVVEVEWRSPFKVENVDEGGEELAMAEETSFDDSYVESIEPVAVVAEPVVVRDVEEEFEEYKVQKGDTLQKISMKFFGTTKKYYKIFKANEEALKSPDKIKPGQTIRIPLN